MAHFLNCDWGTSRFRLRLVEDEVVSIVAEISSDQGVAKLSEVAGDTREAKFLRVLEEHTEALQKKTGLDLTNTPVFISGMASSSIGWHEIAYAQLPFPLLKGNLPAVCFQQPGSRPITLFSGLRSENNMMRGEEVELIGWAVSAQKLLQESGQVFAILPGTHSKHVQIRQGVVVDFQTYLTGELYQLLSRQSSLRHSKGEMLFLTSTGRESAGNDWQKPFSAGVELVQREGFGSSLFHVRARQVLNSESPAESAAFLSGLLIGEELQSLCSAENQAGKIFILSSTGLGELYLLACQVLGLQDRIFSVPVEEAELFTAIGQKHLAGQSVPEFV